ncbi:hypothetical protein PFISCL1PPCAC_19744 [Pristionchus fissidentatus]|uniref:N-alpha-acetyltransferase 60 n=1 Tax=Pristionchus fissidentatus TaxID=1538716 RepID=A0AAV5W9G0_9BILA|nr:hypothetical protein PFISCL1PPCAC_19744 [Pristionchus fissidentatus]
MNSPLLITRRIEERDRLGVQNLCRASFPIEYPDAWYDDVVSGVLNSIGIFHNESIVALIVSEYKLIHNCNIEDRGIISDEHSPVVYILSLAVSNEYRRQGLASRLLRYLIQMYSIENGFVRNSLPKALFLHVLSTNQSAISFYRRHGFEQFEILVNYYRLKGGYGDGVTFVLYLNGGHKTYSIVDLCRMCAAFIWSPFTKLLKSDTRRLRE